MRKKECRMESVRAEKEKSENQISEDESQDIAYQNKDIASKMFAEQLKGKSFQVYGVEIGTIKAVLPTNIPVIRVNELRLDNLLELEDGSMMLVDYESEYKRESKVKYLNYLTGIVNRYEKEGRFCPDLRMVVVYTGDIRRETVSESYDVGAIKLSVEPAFLSEIDGEAILMRLKNKLKNREKLNDREQMEFIILPLSYKKPEEKKAKIQETVNLALKLQDREQQLFVLAGILTFTDKIIDQESAKTIRRAIQMTQVAMIFEKEKEEAVNEERKKWQQVIKEEKQKVHEAVEEERKKGQQAVEEEKQKGQQAVEKEKQKGQKAVEEEKQKGQQAVEEEKQKGQQAVEEEKQKSQQAIREEKMKFALKMIADGELSLKKIAEYTELNIKIVTELAGQ